MANPFDIAAKLVGRGERPDRAAIMDYLQTGGVNLDPVTTAWCAAYVNATLAQAGIKGTESNAALSFLNFGSPTKDPSHGDIAVFGRGPPGSGLGHVGFFDRINQDGTIRVLAGNQGNAVSYKDWSPDKLLGFRHIDGNMATLPPGEAGPFPGTVPQDFWSRAKNSLQSLTADNTPVLGAPAEQQPMAPVPPPYMTPPPQNPLAYLAANGPGFKYKPTLREAV